MAGSEVFADGALAGRAVLVTGGGTGLGRAAAAELRRCGAEVVICGRREDVLAAAAAELGAERRRGRRPRRRRRARGSSRSRWSAAGGSTRSSTTPAASTSRRPRRSSPRAGARSRGSTSARPSGWRGSPPSRAFRCGGGTVVNVTLSPHHGLRGHDALERRARRRRGLHARAGGRVGGPRDRGDRRRRGPLRHRLAAQVPRGRSGGGAARTVPLQRLGREAEHAWLVALCCSPLGAALSGSVVTLDGARDNWFGPVAAGDARRRGRRGPHRGPRAEAARRIAGAPGEGYHPGRPLRAKCCGCTEAFQASRAGSIPVARLRDSHGEWRSLVAHPAGGRAVAGSNPVSPTTSGLTTRPAGGLGVTQWTSGI